MAIWQKPAPGGPAAQAAAQIRHRLVGAVETTRRALEVTAMLVAKHGRPAIAEELGAHDAVDLKRVYGILKAGLADIDPAIVTVDLPEAASAPEPEPG